MMVFVLNRLNGLRNNGVRLKTWLVKPFKWLNLPPKIIISKLSVFVIRLCHQKGDLLRIQFWIYRGALAFRFRPNSQ